MGQQPWWSDLRILLMHRIVDCDSNLVCIEQPHLRCQTDIGGVAYSGDAYEMTLLSTPHERPLRSNLLVLYPLSR